MYNQMAIGFDYPGPDIITSVENGSGVIMPGNSTVVKLNLATASLAEGSVKRSVNFISNDPANAQTTALVQLNITSGGISKPVVSTDTIDFGDVFQGAVRSTTFTVKNEGTANATITSITGEGGLFTITGPRPVTITPGFYRMYNVRISTATLGSIRRRSLPSIMRMEPQTFIVLEGNVIEAPAISVDLTTIQETLGIWRYIDTCTFH